MPDNINSAATLVWQGLQKLKLVAPTTQYENGAYALPALLLNASTTITIPLSGTFPDTNYVLKVRAVTGNTTLGMIQVTNVVKAVNSVNVTVKANGLASSAGLLLVDAYRTS